MKMVARIVTVVAPIAIALGAAVGTATPALASGGCNWGTSQGGVNNYVAGDAVAVNGVVFDCSDYGAYPDQWVPAGTTNANTPGLDGAYDNTTINSNFSTGATLMGDNDDAYVLGSDWADVGSFSDFLNNLTGCAGDSCSPGGGIGVLQP